MSLYEKENAEHLRVCLDSINKQTVKVNEIIIVFDGTVSSSLEAVIKEYSIELNICIIRLEKNHGLGYALAIGLQQCNNELVARMDTDDVMFKDRIEKQYGYFSNHDVDILGSYMIEFETNIDANSSRNVNHYKLSHKEIGKALKYRNPLAHMTVMFKKSVILNCGNYINDFLYFEDYYLWIRAYQAGAKFANLPIMLVYARVDKMVWRRIGIKYLKNEFKLMKWMYKNQVINFPEFCYNVLARGTLRIMPYQIAKIIYNKILRC